MILDYVPTTQSFVVRIPRSASHDIQALMKEHGLDFSLPASTPDEAVLFTHEPYAAAAFWQHATGRAREQLGQIHDEIAASWALEDQGHYRIPADKELWGFQKANLAYALRRRHTLIGDQPGLGKTPTAIAYCNEVAAERVLVICPANIRRQWMERIGEWSTAPWNKRLVHGIFSSRQGVPPANANWTVISYDLARVEPLWRALAKETYDVLILDEAHYLKTVDARRTRTVFGGGTQQHAASLASRAHSVVALTGTPLPNRPREAYTLARHLHWDAIDWMSEDAFRKRFNPALTLNITDPTTGAKRIAIDERTGRHQELQARLRANFMTRHLKREVMPWLKLPVYDLIQLDEDAAIRQALKAESLLEIDPDDLTGADAAILGHVAAVRRMMGVAMAPQIASYIEMLIDGGEEKIVLFYWHVEVGDILETKLRRLGVTRIDGKSSARQREVAKNEFICNPNIQIMLGNLQAMGVGTDGLQHVSSHALIAEPDWTPGNNIQAFDRLDRGGQNQQVQGDIFVAPNSIAERVLASALRKLRVTDKALDYRN